MHAFVCLISVLWPFNTFRSFRARSVNLTTLFLGKPLKQFTSTAQSFASNWQLLFLNQRKRENGRRNVSWPVSMKECAGCGDQTRGRLHTKRTHFRSSYCSRMHSVTNKQNEHNWATAQQNQQNDNVNPAKNHFSLGICPVWSEPSLCDQWVVVGPVFLHAESEDWSDWADAQADLSLCWAHKSFCWFCHVAAHLNILMINKF